MRRFLLVALSSFSIAACQQVSQQSAAESPAVMPASENMKYAGVYAGSYVCAYGENGLTVSIDTVVDLIGAEAGLSRVEGRLWFYDVMSNEGHPKGAFKLAGTVNADGVIEVTPAGWISEIPSNWGAAGVTGVFELEEGGASLSGKPTGPGTGACQDFTLMRLEGLR